MQTSPHPNFLYPIPPIAIMHLLISLTALLLSTVAARPLHSTPTILHDVTIIDECVSSLESAAPDYDGSFKQAWAMYKTANKLKGAGQSAKHAVDKVRVTQTNERAFPRAFVETSGQRCQKYRQLTNTQQVDHLEPADSAAITAEVAKLEPKFEAFLAITDEKVLYTAILVRDTITKSG